MKTLKKVLYFSFWLAMLSGTIVLLSFVKNEHNRLVCSNVEVIIDNVEENEFVTRADIMQMANENRDKLEGQTLQTIDVNKLEKIFNTHPAISNAEVYENIAGDLTIKITQKRPIARIVNAVGESFYMDSQGKLMLWSRNYTARVPVITGEIYESFAKNNLLDFSAKDINDSLLKKNKLYGLYSLAKYIDSDEFWKAQIQQINVGEDIEMIPTLGKHKIVFGDTQNIDEKFKKLLIFYTHGFSKVGWNKYSEVNLKFKNNVVCKK
jgi:cell division protein FtsQ